MILNTWHCPFKFTVFWLIINCLAVSETPGKVLYRCLGHRGKVPHRCLRHRKALLQVLCNIEGLSQLLKEQSIKKLTNSVFYYKGRIKWESKIFPQGAPLSCLPGVSDTGEQFKIRISARKFEKNRNRLRVPLMGPQEAVWWKNRDSKISRHCPFKCGYGYSRPKWMRIRADRDP